MSLNEGEKLKNKEDIAKVTLGMPKEIYEKIVYISSELLAILDANFVIETNDIETNHQYLSFSKYVDKKLFHDEASYYKEISRIIDHYLFTCEKILKFNDVSPNEIIKDNYWRIILTLWDEEEFDCLEKTITHYTEQDRHKAHISISKIPNRSSKIRMKARNLKELQEFAIFVREKLQEIT